MNTYLKVKDLRELLDAIPTSRDEEPVAVYELNEGLRFNAIYLDDNCSGCIDLNFEADQYSKKGGKL